MNGNRGTFVYDDFLVARPAKTQTIDTRAEINTIRASIRKLIKALEKSDDACLCVAEGALHSANASINIAFEHLPDQIEVEE